MLHALFGIDFSNDICKKEILTFNFKTLKINLEKNKFLKYRYTNF